MGSAIRVIVRNERYRGVIHWSTSEWRKDPDTGKRLRVLRPRSEWITHADESLRIVSDALFERAQGRMRRPAGKKQAHTGGKPKYLLSGLLRCAVCGACYVGVNQREYGCSSHRDGGACSNSVRVRRKAVETILLDPIHKELLTPQRAERMAKEMRAYFLDRTRAMETRAIEVPRELQELRARIERLRERLKQGDADMAADEIQAAIDRQRQSAGSWKSRGLPQNRRRGSLQCCRKRRRLIAAR